MSSRSLALIPTVLFVNNPINLAVFENKLKKKHKTTNRMEVVVHARLLLVSKRRQVTLNHRHSVLVLSSSSTTQQKRLDNWVLNSCFSKTVAPMTKCYQFYYLCLQIHDHGLGAGVSGPLNLHPKMHLPIMESNKESTFSLRDSTKKEP